MQPPPKDWLRARVERPQAETAAEWAKIVGHGVSQQQVSNWYRRFGIMPKRSGANPRKIPSPGAAWLNARRDMTIVAIAAEAGVSETVVTRWLSEAGIVLDAGGRPDPVRARIMAVVAPGCKAPWHDATAEAKAHAWLSARATMPAVVIAAELQCSLNFVYDLMHEYDVEYRPVRMKPAGGEGSLKARRQAGEVWLMHECEDCPLIRGCRLLEGAGRRLPCEVGCPDDQLRETVAYEQAFEGKERVTA